MISSKTTKDIFENLQKYAKKRMEQHPYLADELAPFIKPENKQVTSDLHNYAKEQLQKFNLTSALVAYELLQVCDPANKQIVKEISQLKSLREELISRDQKLLQEAATELKESISFPEMIKFEERLSPLQQQYRQDIGCNLSASSEITQQNYDKTTQHMALAFQKQTNEDYSGAIEEITKAIEINEVSALLLFRAKMYIKIGEIERAKQDTARLCQIDPLRIVNFKEFLDLLCDIASAEVKFYLKNKSLKLDTKLINVADIGKMALEQIKNKEYQKFIQYITCTMRATELRENFPIMYSQRGYANLQLKNYAAALYDFFVSIWLNTPLFIKGPLPRNPQEDFAFLRYAFVGLRDIFNAEKIHNSIKKFVNDINDNDKFKAIYTFKSIHQHDEDFSRELARQAKIEISQEQFDIAEKMLGLAIKICPRNIEAAIDYSVVLALTNQEKLAQIILESAVKLDPNNKRVKDNLKLKAAPTVEIGSEKKSKRKGKKHKKQAPQSLPIKRTAPSTVMRDFLAEKESKAAEELKKIIQEIALEKQKNREIK